MDDLTTDTFLNGSFTVTQSKSGYRFSIDPVILSFYTRPSPNDKILDLGTGCGIIPLMLASRSSHIQIYGIEIQKKLAALASKNIIDNGLKNQIVIIHEDMKRIKQSVTGGPVDIVVSNPPYGKINSGRINPDSERAVARHEIKITLSELLATARKMLRTGGRFVSVYPAERTADLISEMKNFRIEPKSIRTIHSAANTEAKLIIAEGIQEGRPGLKIHPPLYIYKENEEYTDEAAKIFLP